MGWLLIWIICGIFSAIIASSKGRNGFGLLVLGLIFGIFALLAVGFMPSTMKQKDTTAKLWQSLPSDERKCPFCAEMIKPEASVCKHCGRDVQPERGVKVCPHCGADVSEYPLATACHSCHRFFNEKAT